MKKIVFLDRDGVINEFPGDGKYVTRVKDFHFLPGALEAIRRLTRDGYTLFVISNQAGVDKGIYSRSKLDQITRHMMRHVQRADGRIRKIFYCTHRSDAGCDCRKPRIGSLVAAMKLIKRPVKELSRTFFIGDTKSDIEAGFRAGCRTIFVLSGHEDRRRLKKWAVYPDFITKNLLEAVQIIEHENSHHPRFRRGRTHQGRGSRL